MLTMGDIFKMAMIFVLIGLIVSAITVVGVVANALQTVGSAGMTGMHDWYSSGSLVSLMKLALVVFEWNGAGGSFSMWALITTVLVGIPTAWVALTVARVVSRGLR